MIEIQITNAEQISQWFERIAEKTAQRSDLMREVAGTMESAVLTNFHEGGRPPWLGVKYRQGTPLVDTQNLMSSISSYYSNDVAVVGTNEIYAPLHHFGGKAGRGKKVDIPARPFLILTPQDEEDLLADVQDYFRTLV